MKKIGLVILVILIDSIIYLYPFIYIYKKIPIIKSFPLLLSTDIYMFLNFAFIKYINDKTVLHPWFHEYLLVESLKFYKFGTLWLFKNFSNLCYGNIAISLICWNGLWLTLTIFSIYYLLNLFLKILNINNNSLLFLGLLFVSLFQVSNIPSYVYLNILDIQLPFYRTFFPQIANVLLIFYIVFLIRAIETNKTKYWIILFFIQFFSFMNYPYITIDMGFMTIVFLISSFKNVELPWKQIISFGFVSIAIDILYLNSFNFLLRATNTDNSNLKIISFNLERYEELIGGTNIFLAIITFLILLLPHQHKTVKYILFSLGISTLSLQLADFVFPVKLQMTHHFAFFVHTVINILTIYIIFYFYKYSHKYIKILITFSGFILVTLLLYTSFLYIENKTIQYYYKTNRNFYNIITLLKKINPNDKDIIIAPSISVDDITNLLPLLYESEVLFSRNVESLLPNNEKGHDLYYFREALYLYMRNIDETTLKNFLFKHPRLFILVDQRFELNTPSRNIFLESIYKDLSKWLIQFKNDSTLVQKFFSKYRFVIIIEDTRMKFPNKKLLGKPIQKLEKDNIKVYVYQ